VLFTFPSRYWFAIGHRGVLRLGGWSPHVRTGFHGSRPTRGRRRSLPVRGCHPLWPRFPARSGLNASAAGLVRVRSPLLAESLLMSFPPATEMFQFAGFASTAYGFSGRYPLRDGFPHSEIFGSQIAPISPKLIAGCDVLHRLSVPRHPPNALLSLENNKDNCLTQGQARRRRRLFSQRNNHGGPTARSAAPDMRARVRSSRPPTRRPLRLATRPRVHQEDPTTCRTNGTSPECQNLLHTVKDRQIVKPNVFKKIET
jgi:hypothetical protein